MRRKYRGKKEKGKKESDCNQPDDGETICTLLN